MMLKKKKKEYPITKPEYAGQFFQQLLSSHKAIDMALLGMPRDYKQIHIITTIDTKFHLTR